MLPDDTLSAIKSAAIAQAVRTFADGRAASVQTLVQAAATMAADLLLEALRPRLLQLGQAPGSRAVLELDGGSE